MKNIAYTTGITSEPEGILASDICARILNTTVNVINVDENVCRWWYFTMLVLSNVWRTMGTRVPDIFTCYAHISVSLNVSSVIKANVIC